MHLQENSIKATLALITKLEYLEQWVDYALSVEYIALDTETDGVHRQAEVVGLACAPSTEEAFYVPIKIWKNGELVCPWSEKAFPKVKELLQKLCSHPKIIAHNSVFDAKVIHNTFQVQILNNVYCDTQLLHHTVIDENPPHGLKELASMFITKEAASPQEDLKQSVIANGGKWVKGQKEFYKGEWTLLGSYACWDVIYTYKLFEMWYPEIDAQGLRDLWEKEVMPLLKASYQLNTNGLRVNLDHFKKLKNEMEAQIESLEDEIYAAIKDKVIDYEKEKLKGEILVSKQSKAGKALAAAGLPIEWNEKTTEFLFNWFKNQKNIKTIFNLDSTQDKAFLLYEVLKLPVKAYTTTGKPAVSKALIDELSQEYEESSDILKLLKKRSKEIKLLTTYVEPILETHQDGKLYPSFIQTGTTSGRFSCGGDSINLMTLPRDDLRIKEGVIPDPGWAFVAADYSSLEPRVFAEVSEEPGIKRIFSENLDFYSSLAIEILGLEGVSANPDAENYLGKVNKSKRQLVKALALAVPYGASGGRIAQLLKIPYEEGEDLVNRYLDTYPKLKQWMDKCVWSMRKFGYVCSLAGRKKRGALIKDLADMYGIKTFEKPTLKKLWESKKSLQEKFPEFSNFYLEVRNLINVSRNHCIQSLAASIMNAAMIELLDKLEQNNMKTQLVLNVHDELVLHAPIEEAEFAAKLLKESMENNRVTKNISVKMVANPVITTENLSKAK